MVTRVSSPFTMISVFAASLSLPPSRHVYIPAWDTCSGENCRVLVQVLPLFVTSDTIAPEARSEELVGPENHSKVGGGESL